MKHLATSLGLGVIVSILASFPATALFALLYRFPIPFSGYEHGIQAVPRALSASVFYGMIGGYWLLFVLGAVAGAIGAFRASGRGQAWRRTSVLACMGTTCAVALLSLLDKITGPW
jgi:hypothetical protein